jgi:hypothetical protein
LYFSLRKDLKSFKNMAKSNGDIFSPCRTPTWQGNGSERLLLAET